MKDLIYRQQAIDAMQGIGRLATLPDNDAVVRMSAVEYVLFNLPSAQPEVLAHGVVKCKDCKHSAMIYSTNMVPVVGGFRAEGIDHIFCQCDKHGGIEMRWDDFCSRAERKSEG